MKPDSYPDPSTVLPSTVQYWDQTFGSRERGDKNGRSIPGLSTSVSFRNSLLVAWNKARAGHNGSLFSSSLLGIPQVQKEMFAKECDFTLSPGYFGGTHTNGTIPISKERNKAEESTAPISKEAQIVKGFSTSPSKFFVLLFPQASGSSETLLNPHLCFMF